MELLQIMLGIAVLWIILISISFKKDIESKGFMVAPGILIWKTPKLKDFYGRFSERLKFLDKFEEFSSSLILILFFVLPIILLINIIRFFTKFASPLFVPNPISNLSIETVLLIVFPLIVALILHELMHAFVAMNNGVEVKYSGFAIIVVFVAAFVQMVPESLSKITRKQKMRIISSPISSNLLLALVLIPILFVSSSIMIPFYQQADGALIVDVLDNTPASNVGLSRGEVIVSITTLKQGQPFTTYDINTANELLATLRNIPIGEKFILNLLKNDVIISGVQPPKNALLISGSYIGVSLFDYRAGRLSFFSPFVPYWFKIELQWMININLILGLFNILPLPMTDGSKIYDLIMERGELEDNYKDKLRIFSFSICGILLLLNILLTVF